MRSLRERAFDEAVERCYRNDSDPKRNSIRYFAPPEDYVEVAFNCLIDAAVEALRRKAHYIGPELRDAIGVHAAADFLTAEFGSSSKAGPS